MRRDVPRGLSVLLGEMFQRLDVDLHYSVDRDNDDTLAFFAHADGADVLSEDSDFFRYPGASFRIFKAFDIQHGQLKLVPHDGCLKSGVKQRQLDGKPVTCSALPAFIDVSRKGQYTRGAPSPLVKLLGNPHVSAQPLRQALYARLGIQGSVREEFPVWRDSAACWHVQDVLPDESQDNLLEDPERAVAELFPELLEEPPPIAAKLWEKHIFGVYAIVHELCCAASGSSFLDAMSTRSKIKAGADRHGRSSKGQSKGRSSKGQSKSRSKGAGKPSCHDRRPYADGKGAHRTDRREHND